MRYTGEHIYIGDENDKKVATLLWYGTSPEDGDEVLIDFGFGFYSEWWDEEVNLPDRGVER